MRSQTRSTWGVANLLEYKHNFLAKHPLGCIVDCGDFNLSEVCWVLYHGASNFSNDILDCFAHFKGIQFG